MSESTYRELFPLGADQAPYRKLTGDHVSIGDFEGRRIVKVMPEALTLLAAQAFADSAHLLRPGHLASLRAILDDPEASSNDRFVALDLLKNANIAAGRVLPMCQDTGTAIVMGKKGQQVWTEGDDAAAISAGIRRTYTEANLRYSQVAPLSMYEEVNTGDNLPAQIDLYAEPGDAYKFLFIAKGGGSANKSFLFQQSKAVLNPKALLKFLDEKIRTLGTAACPPYHLAIVIGGTSAEMNLKTVKLASCRYLDNLPAEGNRWGQAYRDCGFEAEVLELTRGLGIGAQFGGKYFCHDMQGHPLAAPRRQPADRDRRVVRGRPADPRQDQCRGRVSRRAGNQPGAFPARYRRDRPRAGRWCRSTSTARWPRSAAPCPNTRSRRGSA